ncbi:threonine transporter RhtB [Acinetobacter sp. TGL-Y2]|uniref:LysE family translocator n=1 Tax=Acinetobacter sp. TGL-Y2 TaxID=1407071 RepID=UPI0007A66661|nr:LysE family transporter [Acinetobacter sp. TGL-Y2]AMW77532.1 threonine transporter RhtB [Acinetobacter sp. TGL-Y2]
MVASWLFIFAVFAVLLIPGPTNALLASAAHHHGLLKAFYLVPIELLGYIYGISLWSLLIHLTMPTWPMLIHLLHLVSASYVIWLAFHLWKSSHLKQHSLKNKTLNRSMLFKSTLHNPKSILFAVGIFPAWTWDSFQNYAYVLAIFTLCLVPCALFWIYFGRKVLAGNLKVVTADRVYKGSAMLLLLSMLPVVIGFF